MHNYPYMFFSLNYCSDSASKTFKYLPDFGKQNIASYLCMEIFFSTPINSNQILSLAVPSITSGIKIYIEVVTS